MNIEEHVPLVHYVLHRYYPALAFDDDAIQTGLIALWKASRLFDPARDIQFATYAVAVIRMGIRGYLRDRKRERAGPPTVSLDDYIWGTGIVFAEAAAAETTPDIADEVVSRLTVQETLASFSERERFVIGLIMLERKQEEIGQVLGLNQVSISRIRARVRNRLREGLSA